MTGNTEKWEDSVPAPVATGDRLLEPIKPEGFWPTLWVGTACFVCPPYPVWAAKGCCCQVFVSFLLWGCMGIPGFIHAVYIVFFGKLADHVEEDSKNL